MRMYIYIYYVYLCIVMMINTNINKQIFPRGEHGAAPDNKSFVNNR